MEPGARSRSATTERTSGDGTDCPLRFPGQYFDEESGWHYNFHRYYDPDTGQYTSSDPLGLTPVNNNHTYVPNLLSWLDRLGLTLCKKALALRAWRLRNHGLDAQGNKIYAGITNNLAAERPNTSHRTTGSCAWWRCADAPTLRNGKRGALNKF